MNEANEILEIWHDVFFIKKILLKVIKDLYTGNEMQPFIDSSMNEALLDVLKKFPGEATIKK